MDVGKGENSSSNFTSGVAKDVINSEAVAPDAQAFNSELFDVTCRDSDSPLSATVNTILPDVADSGSDGALRGSDGDIEETKINPERNSKQQGNSHVFVDAVLQQLHEASVEKPDTKVDIPSSDLVTETNHQSQPAQNITKTHEDLEPRLAESEQNKLSDHVSVRPTEEHSATAHPGDPPSDAFSPTLDHRTSTVHLTEQTGHVEKNTEEAAPVVGNGQPENENDQQNNIEQDRKNDKPNTRSVATAENAGKQLESEQVKERTENCPIPVHSHINSVPGTAETAELEHDGFVVISVRNTKEHPREQSLCMHDTSGLMGVAGSKLLCTRSSCDENVTPVSHTPGSPKSQDEIMDKSASPWPSVLQQQSSSDRCSDHFPNSDEFTLGFKVPGEVEMRFSCIKFPMYKWLYLKKERCIEDLVEKYALVLTFPDTSPRCICIDLCQSPQRDVSSVIENIVYEVNDLIMGINLFKIFTSAMSETILGKIQEMYKDHVSCYISDAKQYLLILASDTHLLSEVEKFIIRLKKMENMEHFDSDISWEQQTKKQSHSVENKSDGNARLVATQHDASAGATSAMKLKSSSAHSDRDQEAGKTVRSSRTRQQQEHAIGVHKSHVGNKLAQDTDVTNQPSITLSQSNRLACSDMQMAVNNRSPRAGDAKETTAMTRSDNDGQMQSMDNNRKASLDRDASDMSSTEGGPSLRGAVTNASNNGALSVGDSDQNRVTEQSQASYSGKEIQLKDFERCLLQIADLRTAFFARSGVKGVPVEHVAQSGKVTVKYGEPEKVREVLATLYCQETIEVESADHEKFIPKLLYFLQKFQPNILLFSSKNREGKLCTALYYFSDIDHAIGPELANLKIVQRAVPVPLYVLKYVRRHALNLNTFLQRRDGAEVKIEFSSLDILISAECTEITRVISDLQKFITRLRVRVADINPARSLYFQGIMGECHLKMIEQNTYCQITVKSSGQLLRMQAESSRGQRLLICEGSMVACDCQIQVLPLYEGQIEWSELQRYLHRGLLSSDLKAYIQVIQSTPEPSIFALDCGMAGSEKKTIVVMYIPPQNCAKLKEFIRKQICDVMQKANSEFRAIALPLQLSPCLQFSKSWKYILQPIVECFEKDFCHPTTVIKLYSDTKIPHSILEAMDEFLNRNKWNTESETDVPCYEAKSRVQIHVGDILKEEGDVLVNSTDPALSHTFGVVSQSLLEKAGRGLEVECKRFYPKGIGSNYVVETSSGELQTVKKIFHIVLPQCHWNEQPQPQRLLDELHVRMQSCLTLASMKGYHSIIFPTLGTGTLQYPPFEVAKTMLGTARDFFTGMPHSSVEKVIIVCYHTATDVLQAFRAEEMAISLMPSHALQEQLSQKVVQITVNETVVQGVEGDPSRKTTAKMVICSCQPYSGMPDDHQYKQWGNELLKLDLTASSKWKEEFKKKLDRAAQMESLQINLLTFDPKCHHEFVDTLMKWLEKVERCRIQLLTVLVANIGDFQQCLTAKAGGNKPGKKSGKVLPSVTSVSPQNTDNPQRTVLGRLYLCGRPCGIKSAMKEVEKADIPEEYIKWVNEYQPGVSVDLLSDDTQQASSGKDDGLEKAVKWTEEQPVRDVEATKRLSDSGVCALMIPEQSLKDMDRGQFVKFLQDHKLERLLQKDASSGWGFVFRGKFEDICKLTTLLHGVTNQLSAEKSEHSKTGASEPQDFTKVLDMMQYEALKHLLGKTFTESVRVTEENGNVTVKSHSENPSWLNKFDSLRREDLQLPADVLERLGRSPLDTTEENLEAFIRPLHDQGKVAILAFDYNAITKAKHLVSVKAGKVKVTTRARRRFDGTGQGEHSLPQSLDSSSSLTVNSKEFITKCGIRLLVYKTDITKLPVDAIVNAANGHLNHGGGVAYAIARAAGTALEEEGDAYVKTNGPLKVMQVVPTTAGAMPCRKVLHAVGPRWDDYQDKVQCQQDLEQTVFNCLETAHNLKFSSLAVSSISSAIFGVPQDLCARMYLSAVKSFDQQYWGRTSLQVIHFVDVNDHMVSVIQDVFTKGWDTNGMASGGNDTPYIHQGAVPPPEKSVTASSSHQTGYSSRAEGEECLGYAHRTSQGTVYPVSGLQTNPPHTAREEGHLKDPVVTVVQKTGSSHNYHQFHFVNLELIFQQHKVSRSKTDAVILWQYAGYLLQSEDTKELLKDLNARDVTSLKCNLMCETVKVVMTDQKLFILPVVLPHSVTREKVRDLFEQAMNKADKHGKKSVAVTCFSSQPDSRRPMTTNKDVAEYAAGIYLAVKNYTERPHRSITQVYIMETDFNTLIAMEESVTEVLAIERSKVGLVNNERPQSTVLASISTKLAYDTRNRGSDEPQCVICQDKIRGSKSMKCGHVFCSDCIDRWMTTKPVCPSCQTVLGIMIGNQPTGGTMSMHYSSVTHLPDYGSLGVYVIDYSIPSGKQTDKHPKPGRSYRATSRKAYLPDTPDGRKVLMLLKVAFDRCQVFTVGRSTTTGRDDSIIWNDIHHKTNISGGSTSYGYPDRTYLDRVQKELAAKGVTFDDLTETQKDFIQNPDKYHKYSCLDFCHEFCGTDV